LFPSKNLAKAQKAAPHSTSWSGSSRRRFAPCWSWLSGSAQGRGV